MRSLWSWLQLGVRSIGGEWGWPPNPVSDYLNPSYKIETNLPSSTPIHLIGYIEDSQGCGSSYISTWVFSADHGNFQFRSLVGTLFHRERESRRTQSHKCLYIVFLSSLGDWKGSLGMAIIENTSEANLKLIVRRFFTYYIFSVSNSGLRNTIKFFPTKLRENQ